MKKILSMALALTMASSMAVSAAASSVAQATDPQIVNKLYTYDSKSDKLTELVGDPVPGGVYYMLIEEGSGTGKYVTAGALDDFKVSVEVEEGSKLYGSASLVTIDVAAGSLVAGVECTETVACNHTTGDPGCAEDCPDPGSPGTGSGCDKTVPCNHDTVKAPGCTFVAAQPGEASELMALKLTTKNNLVLGVQDFDITLKLARTRPGEYTAVPVNVVEEFRYNTVDPSNLFAIYGNNEVLFETNGYAQDGREDTQIFFGDNDITFSNSMYRQNDLFIGFTDSVIDKYEELYGDKAALDYAWFTMPVGFRQAGTLTIPAAMIEDGKAPFLYEERDGKLVEIKNAYDKNEEAFVLKGVSVLGKYIISDVALDVSASVDGNGNNTEENPETGAGNAMAIAAGLAVVSLIAAGAVALKK